MSATTWMCKTMHVDHHHNKLEQKKVLNRLLSVEKLAIVFYLLYFVLRWPMILLVVTCNLKAFHSPCDTKTFGTILLRGLLYNENNDWALSARLKFLSGRGVKALSHLVHLYPLFWNKRFSLVFFTLRICFSICLKKSNLFNAMEGCLTYWVILRNVTIYRARMGT